MVCENLSRKISKEAKDKKSKNWGQPLTWDILSANSLARFWQLALNIFGF